MNWKRHLFKPKWQHKNADIRLESVTNEQHPELISNLLEIAGNDEDKRVRCAAIRRLHQLENILKLYDSETDGETRQLLQQRIHQLASSSHESRPPLKLRMQVVETTSDRDLIEHLAGHAPEAKLRRAALAKVARQGVLGDCAIQDTDATNRRFAASRITQHTSLKRVIDSLRKRDKKLYSELQLRLHQELLEQADPKAVLAEAIKICSALEKLALDSANTSTVESDPLHSAWQAIASNTSAEMTDRYQRICERLAAPPQIVKPPEAVSAVAEIEVEAEAETEAQAKQETGPLEKSVEDPQASAELQQLEEKREKERQQAEKKLAQAQEMLVKLESELEQGELHKALETRTKLQQAGKGQLKNKGWKQINSKMSAMHARLRELRDWQNWSNNKIRKRLIAEMEVLPAADLHPDALLDRIKSLQTEWKTLEQSEQIPGDKHYAAAPWMWRKFSAAGHTAFDTAKPYLDKRSEIQSRHAQSLATFCAELEQLALAEPVDLTALGKGLNRGRKKLHDLNNVPAKQRHKLARQLKTTLDKANGVMQAHYATVEKEKMKLIRAASQLAHMPERSEAITQAKSLQANWKAAGSLWRSKEQELWNQFREHLDPLFAELKEQQASIRAIDDERLASQKALCSELKEILKSNDDLSAQHGKVMGLRDSWKDIEHPDRKLLQSFQLMVEKYEQQLEQAQQQEVNSNRERWWLKSALLHELTVSGRTAKGHISKKTESSVQKAWPEDSSDDTLETLMDQTYRDIITEDKFELTEAEVGEMTTQARTLCIGLEFIAGLPSPDEDKTRRMQYQVDRLAESMSGESARQPASDEAAAAEKKWLAMYALPEAEFKRFGKRIKLAINTIMESI